MKHGFDWFNGNLSRIQNTSRILLNKYLVEYIPSLDKLFLPYWWSIGNSFCGWIIFNLLNPSPPACDINRDIRSTLGRIVFVRTKFKTWNLITLQMIIGFLYISAQKYGIFKSTPKWLGGNYMMTSSMKLNECTDHLWAQELSGISFHV